MGKEEVVAGHGEQTNGQELLKKLLCNWGGGDERECWRTARTERILKSIQNPLRVGKKSRENRLQMMLQRGEEKMNKEAARMKRGREDGKRRG